MSNPLGINNHLFENLAERQAEMRARLTAPKPKKKKKYRQKKRRGAAKRRHQKMRIRKYRKEKKRAQFWGKFYWMRMIRYLEKQDKAKRAVEREAERQRKRELRAEADQKKAAAKFNSLAKGTRRGKAYEVVFNEGYLAGWKAREEFEKGTTQAPPLTNQSTT